MAGLSRIVFKKLFSTFIFSILISFTVFADEVISIQDSDKTILIGKQCSYLEDPYGNFTLTDILLPENQFRFKTQDKNVFSRPATRSAFWYKFTVSNATDEDLWLEVSSTYAWFIDFYFPDTSGKYLDKVETGTMRPDENKLYDVNLFWLPLNASNDTTPTTYYLRIKSGMTYELPLHVGTIRSLSKAKDLNDFLTAGFLGLMLIMFLYNAFIYFSTRDKIYIYYLGYILLMALSMPYANGYPFIQQLNFWFIDKQWWNNYFLFWHPPVYFFVGAFCINYLNLARIGRIIRRIIQLEMFILAVGYPLLTLIGVPFVDLVNSIQSLIVVLYLTCLITGYYYAIKGIKQAYFYIAGWTFMVAGAIIFFAVVNGFLPYSPLTRNTLYFGVALEVWMFSLALGNRLNILRKEKEQIKEESYRIISQQKKNLEKKVKERTKELQQKNNELVCRNEELKLSSKKLNSQSQQLLELNATKDRLFAIVSHDLRTPIISLKNLLQLVDEQSISPENYSQVSSKIKDDVEHLHFTLNNLLQWAYTQMQGLKTNVKEVLLYPLIKESESLMHEYAKNKNIAVENNVNPQTKVHADPDHIKLIFRNLINNALKYTPNGGTIKIKTSNLNGNCTVSVSDNGVGMNAEIMESLFKEKSIKSRFGTEGEKGTGLGLMLCKEFIEKNGGKIWAESEEGKGSTFSFSIPVLN